MSNCQIYLFSSNEKSAYNKLKLFVEVPVTDGFDEERA